MLVLCRLQPLTNELSTGGGSSTPTPKALLPIGNVPMIFHPIQWLQSANIVGRNINYCTDFSISYTVVNSGIDILVVCPASHKPLIHEAIWRSDESSPSFSHLSITLEGIEDKEAESLDTADILRKFTSRFVVSTQFRPMLNIFYITMRLAFWADGSNYLTMRLCCPTETQTVYFLERISSRHGSPALESVAI